MCRFRGRKILITTYDLEGNLSHRGHNGIKSVQNRLRNNEFKRLMIGIDRPKSRNSVHVSQHVLSNFTGVEMKALENNAFPKVYEILKDKFLV